MDGSCCVCVFLSCGHLWGDLCTGFLSSGLGGLPVLGPRAGEGMDAGIGLTVAWARWQPCLGLVVHRGLPGPQCAGTQRCRPRGTC